MPSPFPIRFSLRSLLIFVALVGFFLGLSIALYQLLFAPTPRTVRATPVARASRDVAMEQFVTVLWQLQFIAMRMTVPSSYGTGSLMLSWRAAAANRFATINAPEYNSSVAWNHRLNQSFDNRFFDAFCFDADGYSIWDRHFTNVVAVTGRGSAWDGAGIDFKQLEPDIVVLVEVSSDAKIEWLEPRDLHLAKMPQSIGDSGGICGNYDWGFMVGFADGDIWLLKPETPFDVLEPFLSNDGARQFDRDVELLPFKVQSINTGMN